MFNIYKLKSENERLYQKQKDMEYIDDSLSFEILEDKNSFKFTNLNVESLDNSGNLQFIFKTKNARITELSQEAQAKDSILSIYQENIPYYDVISNQATVTNNGDEIKLTGGIKMTTTNDSDFSLPNFAVRYPLTGSNSVM